MACACFRNAWYVSGGREAPEEGGAEREPPLKASGSQSVCEQKARTSTPASAARARTAESRARAKGSESLSKVSFPTPHAFHALGSSSSGLPRSTTSLDPRERRPASRSRRHSRRKL